ncbi:MAG TPA: pitrilysin family protein [Steroidobacteraceae bacterium]|nr:pitrilysin family protein [Steroidobacteraceae bacterium]
MRMFRSIAGTLAAVVAGCAAAPVPSAPPAAVRAATPAQINVPVEYYRLPNGLRVVLSRDPSVPTVTIAMYYHIGWRIEPRDRTGFAHLFEHLMFQETTNLAKGEADKIVSGNGGVANGSTHFDYTNYFQVVPSHVVEPVLWVEAERMRGLALTPESLQNQKDVVKNEVRVNVINQPYGSFPWLDLPEHANVNWYNAHNFYGDFKDIDAATLADVRAFYDTYYVPANAALVVAGDFDSAATRASIARYFAPLPARPEPPRPDVSEPPQLKQRSVVLTDPLAPRPALAIGYHVPERNTPAWYAFGLLDEILLQGDDSRLWQRLVTERGYSDSVEGGINLSGNMFDYDGPALWSAFLIHDPGVADAQILRDVDEVISHLQTELVSPAELERALTKIRSALYDVAGSPTRFGLVELLASFALYDDDPARINRLEAEFRKVTPELLRRTAQQYLVPTNRTCLSLRGARMAAAPKP